MKRLQARDKFSRESLDMTLRKCDFPKPKHGWDAGTTANVVWGSSLLLVVAIVAFIFVEAATW